MTVSGALKGQGFKQALISAAALIAILSAVIAVYFMQEITAQEYRLLRTTMKDGNTAARQEIATRMMDGKVNKWEYSAIVQALWSGNAPAFTTASATSVAEERLVLLAMARQVALPR
jgi:hypothetical protein